MQVGTGALVGGAVAELTGGKFYQGAMMGAVSGAVGFVASELVGPYMSGVRRAESELRNVEGLGTIIDQAKDAFKENGSDLNFNLNVGRKEIADSQYAYARQIYDRMVQSLSPETKFWTTFDLGHGGFKIGPYHFQPNAGFPYSVHFEWDIMTHFFTHGVFESWRP